MNYRHIYHAGNFADVFKHAVITLILDYIAQKDKPFAILDSHAGTGLYDLTADEVKRSPEFLQGIALLLNQPPIPELKRYTTIVQNCQIQHELNYYPGSPVIAQHFLREQDELILNELHPDDFLDLKNHFKYDQNIHCHQRDAYEFLLALLPPKQKRGLVIIDPPFEKEDEFKRLLNCLKLVINRFATGTYLIWYPIVSNQHHPWIKQIINCTDLPLLHAYFTRTAVTAEKQGLIGNGVLVINPPWHVDQKIKKVTQYLCDLFKLDDHATWDVAMKRIT